MILILYMYINDHTFDQVLVTLLTNEQLAVETNNS